MTARILMLVGVLVCAISYAGDAFEPDDSALEARPVGDGIIESGRSLDPQEDEDWYSVMVTTPGTIIVEVFHRNGSGEQANVSVRDAQGTLLRSGQDSVAQDVGVGLHTITLRNNNEALVFNYTISIFVYPSIDDEDEYNDDFASATPLPANTFLRNRSLTSGDKDYYLVDVGDSPRPVVFQTMSPARFAKIKVLDANGSDENFGIINRSFVDTLDAGMHAFLVEPFLSTQVVPTYELVFWFRDQPDPYEDDDVPNQANRIRTQGAEHSGVALEQIHSIHNSADEDWFRFYLDEGVDTFTVRANRIVCDDPKVEVWNSSATERLGGPGFGSLTLDTSGSGEYLARIFADGNPQPNGVYGITVDTIPIPRLSQGSLVGSVIRSAKGTNINGASIELSGSVAATRTTDSQGIYSFDALPQGPYTLTARAEGFNDASRAVQIGSAVTTAVFTLDPEMSNDLNGDMTVNSIDIQLAINAVLGLGGTADVNNDGSTNSVDIQLIINDVLGI